MRAAGTELAAANARALVSDWIADPRHAASPASPGSPATTARRIIAWLQHSSVVLQGAEFPFYRAFLKSLAVQIRFCARWRRRCRTARRSCAPASRSPSPRCRCRRRRRRCAPRPAISPSELERQILPDGGHISRNPMAVLELLADLLPLRQTYANQAEAPPPR